MRALCEMQCAWPMPLLLCHVLLYMSSSVTTDCCVKFSAQLRLSSAYTIVMARWTHIIIVMCPSCALRTTCMLYVIISNAVQKSTMLHTHA